MVDDEPGSTQPIGTMIKIGIIRYRFVPVGQVGVILRDYFSGHVFHTVGSY
jgi:hypothetical protein